MRTTYTTTAGMWKLDLEGKLWTVEEVAQECEKLAGQLKKVEENLLSWRDKCISERGV